MTFFARAIFVAVFCLALPAVADDSQPGPLLIIGGGLLPNNLDVYKCLIAGAGGVEKARVGIFPTASASLTTSQQFRNRLMELGLSADKVQIFPLQRENAREAAEDPALASQIRTSTALFFVGGDQIRLLEGLERPDRTPTAALRAVHDVWQHGGLIAGTSAGAAIQSNPMISFQGRTSDWLDALDYGVFDRLDQPSRHGLILTRGWGFFRDGIIDQHFGQRRGRLGRLVRATIESKKRYGFGIDENTALAVDPQGRCEVLGKGSITLVDALNAVSSDGPLGYRVSGVLISSLQQGDRFDAHTGTIDVHPAKLKMVPGTESSDDNFVVPDIAAPGAVLDALQNGLADNAASRLVGISMTYHGDHAHGYQFTFTKSEDFISYTGLVNGDRNYAVRNVRLDVEPIVDARRASAITLPTDLPANGFRTALMALSFRGILTTDRAQRIRPDDTITRAEFATGLSQALSISTNRTELPKFQDVAPDSADYADILRVTSHHLMEVDAAGKFNPTAPVLRCQAAVILMAANSTRTATKPIASEGKTSEPNSDRSSAPDRALELERLMLMAVDAGFLQAPEGQLRPTAPITRARGRRSVLSFARVPLVMKVERIADYSLYGDKFFDNNELKVGSWKLEVP